jgi:adenylate cyclase
MPKEIERKFLVRKDLWYALHKPAGEEIRQGYLMAEPGLTIRIRIRGSKGFLTIKGITRNMTRDEYEYEVPVGQAEELFALHSKSRIEKVRYTIGFNGFTWEVDEFFGENEGLIIAEIELTSEDQEFARPPWLGEEVTSDSRYYNSYLAEKPFSTWT